MGNMNQIQNISSWSKIKPEYQELLNELKIQVENRFSTNLVAFYLLGSIGRGDDKPDISDMDTQIFVNRKITNEDKAWLEKIRTKTEFKYPKLERLDIDLVEDKELTDSSDPDINKFKFILKTDTVLICGKDITASFESFSPGLELAQLLNHKYRDSLEEIINYLPEPDEEDQNNPEYIKEHVRWIAKKALRLSLGIIMVEEPFYTRIMEEMANKFSDKYPIYESQIQKALLQYHQPTNNLNQPLAFCHELSKTIYKLADEKLI